MLKKAGPVVLVVVSAVGLAVALASGASGQGGPPSTHPGLGPAHWYGPGGTFGQFGAGPQVMGRAPIGASGAASNLTNPSNNPIMVSTRTHVIFWLPSGFHYSNGTTAASDLDYENTVLKYFKDVGGSQILNTATQYTGSNGTVTDSSTFVDSMVDTNAFPHSGVDVANAVTQGDINNEVFTQIGAHSGWNYGLGDMYFVFLPNNLVDCNNALTQCNTNKYCAYHTYGTSGSNTFVWADIPDNRSVWTTGGCGDSNVTGNESADTTLSSVEHEHLEAITDPLLNAWQDSKGAENGDKCNREMGVADSSTSTANNYLGAGNADLFRIQREWSNAASLTAAANGSGSGCAASYTTGGSHVVAPAPSGGDVVDSVAEASIAGNTTDSLDYTLTITNPSNQDDAYDITAVDTLPTGVQYAGLSTITFHLGDLAPHQTVTKTFTAHPTAALLAGTVLHNSAAFSFDDSTGTYQPTITRTATTTVVNAQPVLTVPGPQTQDFNDALSFGVSATDANAGDTLSFSASGLPAGLTLTDNGNRTATVSGTLTATPGTYTTTITVDDHHHSSPVSKTVTITVTREESKVAYTGPATAHYHDAVTVSATLTDPVEKTPIAGRTITFKLGSDTCTDTTNGSGVASCSLTPNGTGTQSIVASFAGDTYYVGSGDSTSFAITPEETTMAYTGPTVILAGGSGVTLTATMVEDGSNDADADGGSPAPDPTEPVTLSVGLESCTGTTDATTGDVSCTIPSVTVPLGPETVKASFTGDAHYQASSDSKTAIVFAFPSRGAFLLGNTTVAGAGSSTVTWWGDTWWQLNDLSQGQVPPELKGFAGTVTLPSTTPPADCGGDWTTTGGNSPPPVGDIPSYMGVVVTSKVDRAHGAISGNTVQIVVVRVDAGYAPDPMDHGTGTIVATYC